MASQSADIGGDSNQDRPLRSPVPSLRGKANRLPSTRVFGSHVVLDDCRSRKQTARFQNLLQQPTHAYRTGRANAGYVRVTTNCQSPLISLATSLPILISDTYGCLIFQRLRLTAVSGQPPQKPGLKSSEVCVLGCSAFRGSDRFTATVSIRQRHPVGQFSTEHFAALVGRPGSATRRYCRRTTLFARVKRRPGWPPPVRPCSRERGLLWLIRLTLTLHLVVLLHHFLLHLLPFGLLVRCQDGVDLLRGRRVEFLHLRLLIRWR